MVTEQHIIACANKLFVQHGIKTITMNRLVKELHTSKRTIYKYFADKTELLKACLDVYHTKVKEENQAIIDNAENAIEAMGYLHQKIVRRASQVNPSFFNDILHYYPGLLQASYKNKGNFAHQQLVDLAKWGIKDGIFLPDVDIELMVSTVLSLLELLKDNNKFPVAEYSKERLTFGILVPYLRGNCTRKGLELVQMQEELFKVTL